MTALEPFELMSVVAYALTGYGVEHAGPLEGAINFAVTNSVGSFCILFGIGFLLFVAASARTFRVRHGGERQGAREAENLRTLQRQGESRERGPARLTAAYAPVALTMPTCMPQIVFSRVISRYTFAEPVVVVVK